MREAYKVKQLGLYLQHQGARVACAESCTGGLLAATLTHIAGASQWFEGGYITYSNEAKQANLGVSAETLKRYGAVSEETAIEMANGVLQSPIKADYAVSITGVAGPDGGTESKPVGMVCFAFAKRLDSGGVHSDAITRHFTGSREQIREQAVSFVLDQWLARLGPNPEDSDPHLHNNGDTSSSTVDAE
ncbi:MAG TPA: CinA family protein [Paenalcaligenes sp.]|nr:CinA family protein [Paenalcaligenes sp.]